MRSQSPIENKEGTWKCRVLYSYSPQYEDELRLVKGELITVLHEVEEGWWKGLLNGKVGMFPSNFVEKIDASSADSVQNAVKPEINGNPADSPDCKKKKSEVNGGQIGSENSAFRSVQIARADSDTKNEEVIKVTKTDKVPAKASKVTPLEKDKITINIGEDVTRRPASQGGTKGSSESIASPPTLPPKPVRELVRVLYPYSSEHDDELELEEGDVIMVLNKDLEDVGWWKGELNGKVGVFPDNFVEPITHEETVKPPRPEKPVTPSLNSSDVVKNGMDVAPPPIPDKNPPMLSDKKTSTPHNSLDHPTDTKGSSESLSLIRERPLTHQTQTRPKGPSNRRPPSQMFLDCKKSPPPESAPNTSIEDKDLNMVDGDSVVQDEAHDVVLPPGVSTEVPWMKELKANQIKKRLLGSGSSDQEVSPSGQYPKTSTPVPAAKPKILPNPTTKPRNNSSHGSITPNGSQIQESDTSIEYHTPSSVNGAKSGSKKLDEDPIILSVRKEFHPQIKKLEQRIFELHSQHTRQLKLLMDELDEERKKRACMEIELQRLSKLVSAYATV